MTKYLYRAAAIALFFTIPSVVAAQSLTPSEPIAANAAETTQQPVNTCLWTYAESYRREDFSVITIPLPIGALDPEIIRDRPPGNGNGLPIAIVLFPVMDVGQAWLDYASGCCSACSGNQQAIDLLQTIFLSAGEQLRCMEGIASHT